MALAEGLAHEIFRGAGFGPEMNERIEAFFQKRATRSAKLS
jgi:hypothetical protein